MADDLEQTIRDNAQGPAEARDDAGSFKTHNLKDQIEADRASNATTRRLRRPMSPPSLPPGRGLR